MIDPLTSLAFSVQSQPGVYAVLLGSGVSRDAQIPTGWGIVEQLVRQLAATKEAQIEGDPAEWYSQTFGEPVGFSRLIHDLAPSRTERQALLRRFIEPDVERPDDRRPTPAHGALARLAKSGHIRVFLTTNFDRLLEQALEAEGISPVVVSTPAAAVGATPFHHGGVVVFKLHGDYLDPDSMLVTEDELAAYDPASVRRLASTLEDYGLVACGWSAEWDPALRSAITAATARRYPLYFATISRPAPPLARELIDARQGVEVEIEDANTFFTALAGRVAAIDALNQPHPLDTAALVAAVKHALPRPERRIELEDLVDGSVRRATEDLADAEAFPLYRDGQGLPWVKAYIEQVSRTIVVVRPVAEVLAVCSAWGEPAHSPLIARAMGNLVVDFDPTGIQQDELVGLRRLPALLCLYAAGMSAVARQNYTHLKALCVDPTYLRENDRGRVPLIAELNEHSVMPNRAMAAAVARELASPEGLADEALHAVFSGQRNYHTPVAEILKQWTAEVSSAYVTRREADSTFQRLEVLLDLIAAHEDNVTEHFTYGPSFGLYAHRVYGAGPEAEMRNELESEGEAWGPVAQGLFGGSADKAAEAFEALQVNLDKVRQDRRWG